MEKTHMLANELLQGLRVAEERQDESATSLLVAGDVCPIGRIESLFLAGRYEEAWGDVPAVTTQHSLCIADLECPLTSSADKVTKSGPYLKADPRCAPGIRHGGFHAVSLANNHILDFGERGLSDTLSVCADAGLSTVGAGRSSLEAAIPLIINAGRVRVAIVAAAENEFSIAIGENAGANGLDLPSLHSQIARARDAADFVLVLIHGGHEYYPYPSPGMVRLCRFLAQSGASVVVCCHVHVPGAVEVHRGVPIVYSMGNLLFDWPEPRPGGWYRGYMVSLKIRRHQVVSVRLIPYEQGLSQPGVRCLSGAAALRFAEEVCTLSGVVEDDELLTRQWVALAKERRFEYLGPVLNLGRIERILLRSGVWPLRNVLKRRLPCILNYSACESHRELLLEVLREELRRGVRH